MVRVAKEKCGAGALVPEELERWAYVCFSERPLHT